MAGLVPVISIPTAQQCRIYRDARDKPGHDGKKIAFLPCQHFTNAVSTSARGTLIRQNSNSEISTTFDGLARTAEIVGKSSVAVLFTPP
jgi:hypothetical protein